MKTIALACGSLLAYSVVPSNPAAQLIREGASAPTLQAAPKQDSSTAQSLPGKLRFSQEIQLTGEQYWSDTGIDVQAGEHLVIAASGKLRYADAKADNGPEGFPRGFKDLLSILALNSAGRGALIGRIGDADTAQPFLIGARRDIAAPVSGRLSVGINQVKDNPGDGTYIVRIEIYVPEAGTTPARVITPQVRSLPGIDNHLFSKIPRRVSDKDGNPGDMVNFLLLGSEDAMKLAFTNAGWVKVDSPRAFTCASGKLPSWSRARLSGSAPPHTTLDSNATSATTASHTRSIRTSTSSAIMSRKPWPPPGSSQRSLTFSQTAP